MQLSITGRRVEITDAIRDYVEKRMKKLEKYVPHVGDAHVVLYTQKYQQFAEVTLKANGVVIHGEEGTEDMYASIDKVVDKLDAQLRKHKERLIKHQQKQKSDEKHLNLNYSIFNRGDIEEMQEEPQVIHTKSFTLKPMSVDEAVMQMDLMNQDFLIFRNSKDDTINVLYRMKDGNYGVIETGAQS